MHIKTSFMFSQRFLGVVALHLLACGPGGAPDAAGGARAAGVDGAAGDGVSQGGSSIAGGGSPQAGRSAGEEAGSPHHVPEGQGGEPSGGKGGGGEGGGTRENVGGHAEPEGGAGGPAPKPSYVNGCFAFVDRTDEAASRSIVWDDALIFDAARCLRVRLGQAVVFAGDHDSHPMTPKGGDTPNPVGPVAVFTQTGVFGYECIPHPSEMNGAIEVIP